MTSEARAKIMGIELTDIKPEKKKLRKGSVSLAEANPELAKEWHPTKNEGLAPCDVSYGSQRKVWWLGKCGHEWEASVARRNHGSGCPVCAGRKIVAGVNDLATQRPDIAAEWHPSKNGELTPCDVSKAQQIKVWWQCAFGHEWQAYISNRAARNKGNGCPQCSKGGNTSYNEMALLFYIRKIYPDAISRKRIGEVEADILIPQRNIVVEYDGEPWHTKDKIQRDLRKNSYLRQAGYSVIRVREPKCPELPQTESVIIQIEKRLTPVFINEAIVKVLQYLCSLDVDAKMPKVDIKSNANDIATCFDNEIFKRSLAARFPELLKEWDTKKNGRLSPEVLSAGSGKSVWWLCPKGHSYRAMLKNRVRGSGCPFCSGQAVLQGFNDLESQRPELLAFWDYEKNINLLPPSKLHFRTKAKAWFRCACGTGFMAPIKSASGKCFTCAHAQIKKIHKRV